MNRLATLLLIFIASPFLSGCQPDFLMHRDSDGLIYLWHCDHVRAIHLATTNNRHPVWSPEDGGKFAYVGEDHAGPGIFLSDKSGSGPRRLVALAGTPTADLVWGKRGEWLYFNQ